MLQARFGHCCSAKRPVDMMHVCKRYDFDMFSTHVRARVCTKVSIPFVLKLPGSTILRPTTTANHEFGVRPCRRAAQRAVDSMCTGAANTPRLLALGNQPRDNKTHVACLCAPPLPTSLPHASLRLEQGGGGGHTYTGWAATGVQPLATEPAGPVLHVPDLDPDLLVEVSSGSWAGGSGGEGSLCE